VLLGAIVIVLVRSNKPQNTDLPPIALPTATPTAAAGTQGGAVEIKPLDPAPAEPTPTAATPPSTGGTAAVPAETAKSATGSTTKGTGTAATAAPPKGDPCDACLAAAASGNASGVNATVGKCTDAGKQAQCKAVLGRSVPGAVKQAALNGQCARAKALVAAAEAAGIKGADRGLKGSSCQ
jgi:hypothetical protein